MDAWRTVVVVVAVLVGTAVAGGPAALAEAPPVNAYVPVPPMRLLDTREPGSGGRWQEKETRNVTVVGVDGIPAEGADAVVVNITAIGASAPTHLTAWRADHAMPNTSNLNVGVGGVVSNLAAVTLFSSNLPFTSRSATQISLFNNAGSVDVVVDVIGYWSLPIGSVDPIFGLFDPLRVADTRAGGEPIGGGETRAVSVSPRGFSGMFAMNITATDVTAASHLTVWAPGDPEPPTSNINLAPGDTRAGLVFVRMVDGFVNIRNNAGTTDVIVDLDGGIEEPPYHEVGPTRVYDSRGGSTRLAAGEQRDIEIAGVNGVPASGLDAVVLNVTAIGPSAASHLTVWPAGASPPGTSNVNVVAGRTAANLVIVPLGESSGSPGWITIRNNSGTTDLAVDVLGHYGEPSSA